MSTEAHETPASKASGRVARAESPVQDAATLDTFVHTLNDRKFFQSPTELCAVTREGKPYPLLAGRLAVAAAAQLRDLDVNRRPESTLTDTVFTVHYRPQHSDAELSAPVSAIDLDAREPSWPDVLGVRPRTTKRTLENVGNAVRAMGQTLERAQGWSFAYACSGPLRQDDDTLVFLRHGRPALTAEGDDPALSVAYPEGVGALPGVSILDLDDPSDDEDDLEALLRVLDLTPDQPAIGLTILAQLAWAPWSALPDLGRVAVMLAGESGLGKTAIAGAAVVAAQSSTFQPVAGVDPAVPVKMRGAQATVFGVDKVLMPLSGLVGIVDDWFADKMSGKEIGEQWKRLSLIGDNMATGAGGTRGGYRNGRSFLAKSQFPRCCVLATAENLPDEAKHASATARYVALKMESAPDLDVLTEIQANPRALSRAHAGMIRAGLRDPQRAYKALEWGKATVESWEYVGHRRVLYGYARIAAGAWLLAERARELSGVDPSAMLAYASETLRGALIDQTRRAGLRNGRDMSRDAVRLFVRRFREALAAGTLWAAAPERPELSEEGTYLPPSLPSHGAHALGWRQVGGRLTPAGSGDPIGSVIVANGTGRPPWRPVVLRMRATRWRDVAEHVSERVLHADGWSLPAPDELLEKLVKAGYVRQLGVESRELWSGESVRVRQFDLGRILDGDDDAPEGTPPDGAETAPDGPDPVPGTDTPGRHLRAVSDAPSAAEATSTGDDPHVCRVCAEPMSADLFGNGAHATCAPPELGQAGNGEAAEEITATPVAGSDPSAWRPQPEPRNGVKETAGGSPRRPGRGKSRRTVAHPVAALDVDGLWLPGAEAPIDAELPRSKSAAYELARVYDVRQLWITSRAAAALELPTVDDRVNVPTDAGTAHPWDDTDAGTAIASDPVGVAPWMVVWEGVRAQTSRSIVLPHLDTRAAWAWDNDQPRDLDGRTLANAVEAFRVATGGEDYYWSPNTTTKTMARKHSRNLTPCLSIQAGQVPPAIGYRQVMPAKWARELTPDEKRVSSPASLLVRLDRGSAYLSAMGTYLGIGEPTRHAEGRAFDPKLAGYWRIAEVPTGFDPELPELRFHPDGQGNIWLTTPDVALLLDLGKKLDIAEAWVWEKSGKVLYSLYDHIRKARESVYARKVDDPAAAVAFKVFADLYKSFTGELAATRGPKNAEDVMWRPDFRDHLKAEAGARMYRNLMKAKEHNRAPVASYVDAAYFVCADVDDLPAGLVYDPIQGGAWKVEGAVPLAQLGKTLGTTKLHDRFDSELEKAAKEAQA